MAGAVQLEVVHQTNVLPGLAVFGLVVLHLQHLPAVDEHPGLAEAGAGSEAEAVPAAWLPGVVVLLQEAEGAEDLAVSPARHQISLVFRAAGIDGVAGESGVGARQPEVPQAEPGLVAVLWGRLELVASHPQAQRHLLHLLQSGVQDLGVALQLGCEGDGVRPHHPHTQPGAETRPEEEQSWQHVCQFGIFQPAAALHH